MSIDNELRKGEQARQIIESELYQEAKGSVRQAIIDKWIACPMRDREGAHELKIMLKLLGEVTGYIETAMQTGKMAAIQLESERKVSMFAKSGINL